MGLLSSILISPSPINGAPMSDWICTECNSNELVEMDDKTFKEMCKTIKPNIQVVKKKSKNGMRKMCPKCDT